MTMDTVIENFVERTKAILQDNLVGVYLHGSAVMGCFNPDKSDIDLIVVVNSNIPDPVKLTFMDMVVELNAMGPAKGIEMSVVTQSVCKPFVYPTPFDLHFSIGHLDWYRNDPEDYIQKMKGTDKDLAAHFTIIINRGKCLYGKPIEEVFADVPSKDYFDSIREDISDTEETIAEYPMYLILNLARVYAFLEEKLILSKKEGGEWALLNLPAKYHPLIQNALKEYTEGIVTSYDIQLAVDYAKYMLGYIKQKGKDYETN